MRDFDPHRIASEWHSGQGSALYAYASTDRIPTESFKDRLVWEIEHSMANADDEGLDELEWLLMHVEDQHPDKFPGDEMHEVDGMCEACGGMTSEGTCECAMKEAEDLDEIELGWLKQAASKVKDIAMTDVGGPEGILSPSDRAAKHGKTSNGPSNDFKKWQQKRAQKSESTLRAAIQNIVSEMKLSVAGTNPFGFGGAEEIDDEDIAHFLLTKKDASKDVPAPPKSGVKAKAKPGQRKSKKTR